MRIGFYKMHGASNDFILVDDRNCRFPANDKAWLAGIMNRRTGIGSDGTILIQPSEKADFRMRFFNPDGGEVEMCGNGARCIARLASELGAAPENMTIDTIAGVLHAEHRDGQVLLHLTDPKDLRMGKTLDVAGTAHSYHFINTGVPHAVLPVNRVDEVDVASLGAAVRRHQAFAPAGTNANFMEKSGPSSLRVRTFERGVEAETLACGTGITAAAIIGVLAGFVTAPVQVQARSGDILTVNFRRDPDGSLHDVTLLGPAEHVFQGELEYPK